MWKHTRANHPSGGPDSYPASSNALTGQLRCRVAGEPRAAPLPGGGCCHPRRRSQRLLALAGSSEADTTPTALHLAASLVRLARVVGVLRQAQQHAAQAAAARKAAEGLHAALSRSRAGAAALGLPTQARSAQTIRKPADAARLDCPVPLQPGPLAPQSSGHVAPQPSARPRPTLPRVRVRTREPSQSSHDPPHRATASRSTRSRIRSFRPRGVATWVMTPGSSSTPRATRPG